MELLHRQPTRIELGAEDVEAFYEMRRIRMNSKSISTMTDFPLNSDEELDDSAQTGDKVMSPRSPVAIRAVASTRTTTRRSATSVATSTTSTTTTTGAGRRSNAASVGVSATVATPPAGALGSVANTTGSTQVELSDSSTTWSTPEPVQSGRQS